MFLVSLLAIRQWQVSGMAMVRESREQELQQLFNSLIHLEGRSLFMYCNNYTSWDEMVDFVSTGDPVWAKNNLANRLTLYNADALWVLRPDYSLLFFHSQLPESSIEKSLWPNDLGPRLFMGNRFIHFFVKAPAGILELRGATIHATGDPDRKSDPKGYFIAARLWDPSFLRTLSDLMRGNVTITEPANQQTVTSSFLTPEGTFIFHHSLEDWNGAPIAVLTAEVQAPLFRQAIQIAKLEFGLGIVFCVAFFALMHVGLVYWVSRPLHAISNALDTNNLSWLNPLNSSSSEFGYVARLITEFSQQKETLVNEIAERERAERARSRAEEDMRTLLNATTDWVFLTDTQGVFLSLSGRLIKQLGMSEQELLGKNMLDLVLPKRLDRRKEQIAEVIRTGQPIFEETVFGDFFFEISCHPVLDSNGAVVRLAIFMRDITERKKQEEALRKSEERFRKYFELPLIGVAITTPDLHWIAVNNKFCAIMGYPREELEALTLCDLLPKEDVPQQMARYEQLRSGETEGGMEETRYIRKDGAIVHAEVSSLCVHKEDGSPDYFVSLIEDVTQRKRAEAQQKQLEEQLRQAQRLESIGRLAGGIAHDFNNLLSPIMGYTDLALLRLKKDDPLYADLQQIRHASERMRDLIRRFLTFARKQVLEMNIINLNGVVSEFEKMLRRLIEEDIQVVTHLDPALGNVQADSSQIQQIIINLAVNARDAMPNGGVMTIETMNVYLEENYAQRHGGIPGGPYVMLAVSDSGHGMTEEVREHIFEPFFTTKEIGKGTGLGLATVYGIVKQHEGGIWFHSEPGQGTTFRVYLPRVDSDVSQAPSSAGSETSIKGNETVLVVEDDPQACEIVCDVLKTYGYTVLSANHGAEALETAKQYKNPIHLLLTDVVMPGMNGKELYQHLQTIHREAKVLFMSGYTGDVTMHHGVQEGEVEFLQKPFAMHELTSKVRAALGHRGN